MSDSSATDSYTSGNLSTMVTGPAVTNATGGGEQDALLAVAVVVVLAVIFVMALLSNGLVLVVLFRQRRHHTPLHRFMLNLCLADLVVLPQLVWDARGSFPGPDLLCRLVKYLQVLGMFASSFMIVAMTMDRHYAICCPLQAYRGAAFQRWNTFVLLAWGLSLLFSLPQVFIFSRTEVAPWVYDCWGTFAVSWGLKTYVTWFTLAIFIVPVLIITVCQVRIFREIHTSLYLKSERRLSLASLTTITATIASRDLPPALSVSRASSLAPGLEPAEAPAEAPGKAPAEAPGEAPVPAFKGRGISAAMSKMVRMTLVIVLVYSVCAVFYLLMLLASLNSCTNPWIYSAFSSSVSRELRLLLLCRGHGHRRGSSI
ncbi:hypothetical protein NHX12_006135 [Muraenolepis orangiensis]|uniref:G-protein coupled receptors family 1 profile domain-containing protein n=1 Tax=Muraenolepis orangiensis TaxID=630683 RepID=A0A9Q0IEA3_9TELE|nr:hypothetical protein NHX12_006135 [Muraenolepis orangiensis]